VTDLLDRVSTWVGRTLADVQRRQLALFEDWLRSEAIPAGGVGAADVDRLDARHLADSLSFAIGWPDEDPSALLDLGSGVGLPGIPLAILFPETRVSLVDRSGRRTRLSRRASRILGLGNVEVIESDIADLSMTVPAVVSRAALPLDELRPNVLRLLEPGGVGVLAASRVQPPASAGDAIVEIPTTVLDHQAWLRIITRQ
jgi:16S rRNA G527 N7-methylase RsmG